MQAVKQWKNKKRKKQKKPKKDIVVESSESLIDVSTSSTNEQSDIPRFPRCATEISANWKQLIQVQLFVIYCLLLTCHLVLSVVNCSINSWNFVMFLCIIMQSYFNRAHYRAFCLSDVAGPVGQHTFLVLYMKLFNLCLLSFTCLTLACCIYSGWPKVCHNAMIMAERREAHCK